MLRLRQRLLMLLLVALLAGCDHVTKRAAELHLADGAVVGLVKDTVELRYAENTDVAFNLLRAVPDATRERLLLVFAPLAVLLLAVWILRQHFSTSLELLSACAVLAGAIGNTADRLLRGYVVDFVHVAHWPIFNVADVWVTAGLAGLLLSARRRARARPA